MKYNFFNKYLTSTLKKCIFQKLDDIVNEFKKTYHRTIKMKPIVVNISLYINFVEENNCNDPKSKIGNYVRRSKYKTIFGKGYTSIFFMPETYVIEAFNGEKIL